MQFEVSMPRTIHKSVAIRIRFLGRMQCESRSSFNVSKSLQSASGPRTGCNNQFSKDSRALRIAIRIWPKNRMQSDLGEQRLLMPDVAIRIRHWNGCNDKYKRDGLELILVAIRIRD